MPTKTPLLNFVKVHGLKYREIAAGSGVPVSAVHAIVNGFRKPRVDNASKLLSYLRTIDPAVTFEVMFEPPRKKKAA